MATHRTLPAALALLALDAVALGALWGCGLRTDPDSSAPVCLEDEGDTDGEPRNGSCEAPIDVPSGEIVVQGQLGGCDGANGWCGRDGGPEDVYRFSTPNAIDMHVEFNPAATDFIPTLRVLGGDETVDPCEFTIPDSDVCTPDASQRDKWSWKAQPGDTYVIVDGPAAGGQYEFRVTYGVANFGECTPSETIAMEYNVGVSRSGMLLPEQGEYDSLCQTPGDDVLYAVQLPGPGTLRAIVETPVGDGIASIRYGCAANTEAVCEQSAEQFFDAAQTVNVVVDQTGVEGGEYALSLQFN